MRDDACHVFTAGTSSCKPALTAISDSTYVNCVPPGGQAPCETSVNLMKV